MSKSREKKISVVVAFDTTTEAMKMEQYCMQHKLPGRLIPIPREITAGCGIAWKAAPEEKELLEKSMIEGNIHFSYIYTLVI